MLLEILIFFGIISFLLVLLTELGRHTPLGIVAGVIMLFMAYSLLTEGLQTITGQITYTNSTYLNDTSTYNSSYLTSEADPLWSANYSAFNDSWSSTYNSSYLTSEADPLWSANYSAFNDSWSSTAGWTNSSTSTNTNLTIRYGTNNGRAWTLNSQTKSVLHEDFQYTVATYQRITTAPTIATTTETNVVDGIVNFPSSATIWLDGGYVIAGNTATNTAFLNATRMSYFGFRGKYVAVTQRSDMQGIFKSATTIVMNSSLTGVFWYYNATAAATNYTARVCNAGACTSNDTGITADTNWHTFEIIGNNPDSGEATSWDFYIDGTKRATVGNTNRPTTFVSTVGTWTENLDAAADTLRLNWVHYEANR